MLSHRTDVQSSKSGEDVAQGAVDEASKTLRNIRSLYIKEFIGEVQDGKVKNVASTQRSPLIRNAGNKITRNAKHRSEPKCCRGWPKRTLEGPLWAFELSRPTGQGYCILSMLIVALSPAPRLSAKPPTTSCTVSPALAENVT